MNTAFSHALRVHLCPACGGMLAVPIEGGSACCDVCGLEVEFAPRDDAPLVVGQRLEVAAWRAALIRQQSLPDETPTDVAALVTGGCLAAGTENDVLERWQLSRAAVAATRSHADNVKFVGLTMALADHLTTTQDEQQLRALLETALETLNVPHFQQVMLARLARAAMCADDMASADDWLQRCCPHADELRADTAYRVAAAELALRSNQANLVLQLLGREASHRPLHAEEQLYAALLRVTALERDAAIDEAAGQLAGLMAESPLHAELAETRIRDSGALKLCRRSFALARERMQPASHINARDPALRNALPWGALSVTTALAAAWAHRTSWTVAGYRVDLFVLLVALALAVPVAVILARGGGGRAQKG